MAENTPTPHVLRLTHLKHTIVRRFSTKWRATFLLSFVIICRLVGKNCFLNLKFDVVRQSLFLASKSLCDFLRLFCYHPNDNKKVAKNRKKQQKYGTFQSRKKRVGRKNKQFFRVLLECCSKTENTNTFLKHSFQKFSVLDIFKMSKMKKKYQIIFFFCVCVFFYKCLPYILY